MIIWLIVYNNFNQFPINKFNLNLNLSWLIGVTFLFFFHFIFCLRLKLIISALSNYLLHYSRIHRMEHKNIIYFLLLFLLLYICLNSIRKYCNIYMTLKDSLSYKINSPEPKKKNRVKTKIYVNQGIFQEILKFVSVLQTAGIIHSLS